MKYHYIAQEILQATTKITVDLVGCGGTGSHLLTNLAMINYSLLKLGRPVLFVRVWDPDTVSEYNVGRQVFAPSDIGRMKSEVLVSRINRFFGTQWISMMEHYDRGIIKNTKGSNFIISCVDTLAARYEIAETTKILSKVDHMDYNDSLYWLDIGNAQNSGQVILGTTKIIKQPEGEKDTVDKLPDFIDETSGSNTDESENLPSCSMAEALAGQDLFVNKLLATLGANILWNLLKNYRINYRGAYLNLDDMRMNRIPIT